MSLIKNKKLARGVLTAVILLIGGFGIFIIKNTTARTFITPVEKQQWSKYTNVEASYDVEYPSDWKLLVGRSNGFPLFSIFDPVLQSQDSNTIEIEQGAKIEINVIDYDAANSSLDYLSKDSSLGSVVKSPQSKTVNGISAAEEMRIFDDIQSSRIVLSKNGKTYDIYLLIPNPDKLDRNKIDEYVTIFNSLVASFQLK